MQRAAEMEQERESGQVFGQGDRRQLDWRAIDRELRSIAADRAALDAQEAYWLRHALDQQIWRELGMVSALDYVERVLGYRPRKAQDRLRVARALGGLPELSESLAAGRLPYSAVRELTRVATPVTEAAWRDAALGKNLRQIEELVAEHRPGDLPDDLPDPEARTHVVRFELSGETFATLRQTRQVLEDEHGEHLSDDQLVAALCGAVLDGAASEPSGRAKFQIAVTVCERCGQGWQDGAGARVPIGPAAVERARCDAQHVGSLAAETPARAHQDIAPSVARLVWRRDHGRCRIPGCRSARGLEIHHIVHRADGGSHEASNLILACSSCHAAQHDGVLAISGTADRLEVRRRGDHDEASAERGAHVGAGMRDAGPVDVANRMPRRQVHPGGAELAVHVGAPTRVSCEPARRRSEPALPGRGEEPGHAHVSADVPAGHKPTASSTETACCPQRDPTRGAHVDAPAELERAVLQAEAKQALVGLGWKPALARAAVSAVLEAGGAALTLERLIFEALKRCPKTTVER